MRAKKQLQKTEFYEIFYSQSLPKCILRPKNEK